MKPKQETHDKHGLLLVGHGTRSAQGREEFFRSAELVADCAPDALVEPCFLELAEPSITTGVRKLAARGANRLTVAPLLLFAAGHAKRDIPRAVSEAIERTGFGRFVCAEPLGCHPEIVALSRRHYERAVRGPPNVGPERTMLLLVGRGSTDQQATIEMHHFAGLRRSPEQSLHTKVAFLALAHPSLDTTLAEISSLAVPRVVVQPHLLFDGELLGSLRDRINQLQSERTDHQWLLCSHLGPAYPIARAILDRIQQALSRRGVMPLRLLP